MWLGDSHLLAWAIGFDFIIYLSSAPLQPDAAAPPCTFTDTPFKPLKFPNKTSALISLFIDAIDAAYAFMMN